ncbi:hypothetical protein IHE45_18G013200 [Dioscorea alata]|uniref:Uncharacterized protein n=1 Tax=Dioscorea alata TaxID=55571 RepID=A0ACB7U596_DIOAL|nr:hypothetical protein IHE45_18G013200 [Dioscorea alata]
MEAERAKRLMMLLVTGVQSRVALVGGNHTAARFCTR